ncbi:Phosphonate ABC transporter phosphate-binding periplasmic component [Natrarchaeobaculum sulfurireducens]|nr:Phosphonate ABC transporter phosphate-binding periplasmic component [Natrarchaeobaculum sulfurireducens]
MLQDNGLDLGNAVDGGSAEDFEWIGDQAHDIALGQLMDDDSIAAAGAGEFVTIPNISPDEIADNFPEVADISAEFDGAGSDSTDLRLLEASPPLPRAPIVANGEWDDDLRAEIDEFLINADEDVLGHDAHQLAEDLALDIDDEVLDAFEEDDDFDIDDWDVDADDWQEFDDHLLWFTGIQEADASDYDPIADFAADLGIDYDDLA